MTSPNPVQSRRPLSIWTPTFVALLLANFFTSMGQATAGTVLPLYAHDLGAASSLVGFVGGSFAVTALLVRPFAGPAFDSFSKKRILLVSIAVIFAAMLAYTQAASVPALIAVRLLHGAGMGCSAPVALSLVSESLPQDRLAGGVGVYTISQAVAMAVGPAFGIWMSREVGYAAVFGVTAVSLAVSFTLVCLMVRERANAERPPYQLKLSRAFCARATGLTCVLGLMAAAYACTSSFLAIYGGLRGVEQIGLYFTVYALCLVATRPLFGRLADTFGTARVLVPALLCFMVSYLLVSRAGDLAGFLLAAVVAACGFGVCVPLVQALVFKCVPASQRGSASNTCYVGMDVGNLVGPYLAGHAVEAMAAHGIPQVEAYANMWVLLVVPVALALVLFLALRPRVARYVREASA